MIKLFIGEIGRLKVRFSNRNRFKIEDFYVMLALVCGKGPDISCGMNESEKRLQLFKRKLLTKELSLLLRINCDIKQLIALFRT